VLCRSCVIVLTLTSTPQPAQKTRRGSMGITNPGSERVFIPEKQAVFYGSQRTRFWRPTRARLLQSSIGRTSRILWHFSRFSVQLEYAPSIFLQKLHAFEKTKKRNSGLGNACSSACRRADSDAIGVNSSAVESYACMSIVEVRQWWSQACHSLGRHAAKAGRLVGRVLRQSVFERTQKGR
jgi:hypothetical protein